MKTINKVFLILFASLASSPLFAQSDQPFGYQWPQAEINIFVQKVEGAGDLTAAVQSSDGGFVTVSIHHTNSLIDALDNTTLL